MIIFFYLKNTAMNRRNFVAHSIYWKEPNLTSGNIEKREEFLKEIAESVEVATIALLVPGNMRNPIIILER